MLLSHFRNTQIHLTAKKLLSVFRLLSFSAFTVFYLNTNAGVLQNKFMGVAPTPAGFPNSTYNQITQAFDLSAQIGDRSILVLDWKTFSTTAVQLAQLYSNESKKRNLKFQLFINPLTTISGRAIPSIPSTLNSQSFSNPLVRVAFKILVLQIMKTIGSLDTLGLGVDVNLFQSNDPEYLAYISLLKETRAMVLNSYPFQKLTVSFQWDSMIFSKDFSALTNFAGAIDSYSFTSYPNTRFKTASEIPPNYYSVLRSLLPTQALGFSSLGWSADATPLNGTDPELEQARFVNSLPSLMREASPNYIIWNQLHDISYTLGSQQITLNFGLLKSDSTPKKSWVAAYGVDTFGLYSTDPTTGNSRALIVDPVREMTHPRVSKDGQWITFTRYNSAGTDGKAREIDGYDNTEVMVMHISGKNLVSVVPPKLGFVTANSSWTPDGKGIIFVSNRTDLIANKVLPKMGQIYIYNFETHLIRRVPTPDGMEVADPHWVGDTLVFPQVIPLSLNIDGTVKSPQPLWMMKASDTTGSSAHQITFPLAKRHVLPGTTFNLGDYDPRISPDGKKIAFMRYFGGMDWRFMVADLSTGVAKAMTDGTVLLAANLGITKIWGEPPLDAVPDWSPDGSKLTFWHADPNHFSQTGLYTVAVQ